MGSQKPLTLRALVLDMAAFLMLLAPAGGRAQAIQLLPGTTAVGSSSVLLATVTMTAAGQSSQIVALTTGLPGLEYSVAPGGTCILALYQSGDQCTVLVTFTPRFPGVRPGAVAVKTAAGAVLGVSLLSGKATGALPVLVPGQMNTVAGDDQWTYTGDNTAATAAPIFTPQGIALDAAGNLYLSDNGNSRIRRVDAASGTITTVAGNGIQSWSGEGGPATAAAIGSPVGLLLDGAGNLYFSDKQNNVVRRIDAVSQIITTVAGTPQSHGYSGDGGPATAALLNLPRGLAFDSAGRLLIADSGNHVVRQVDLVSGIITTVAGTGAAGFTGDGGPATSAMLNSPYGLLCLPDGSTLIADTYNNRIRSIAANGTITTMVGTGAQGFAGDGGPAAQAALHSPTAITLDPVGNLYIADSGNNRVRFVAAADSTMQTLSGTDSEGFSGDGGPANLASLYGPYDIRFFQNGDVYLSDMFHMRVRRISGSAVSLTYPTMRRGKVSAPQLQSVMNVGGATLVLSTPIYTATALDAATTTCSPATVLAPSASCVLGVEFAPTIIGSNVLGSLALPSNALGTTPTISVNGQVLDVNPTSVALTSSQNPSVVGATVVFSAVVTSDDTGRTGTITFSADGATLCTANLSAAGIATCPATTLSLGSHSIVATYSGDPQNASSTSTTLTQVVKQSTTLVLTSSANPAVVTAPVMFSVTAATASGTPTGTVTFFDGATTLGTATLASGTAVLNTASLAVGVHNVTVQYSGDVGSAAAVSNVLTEIVQQTGTVTTLSAGSSGLTVGGTVTLTATVSAANGSLPTGTVQFAEGGMVYGHTALSAAGTASLVVPALPAGNHAITAAYGGDANSSASTSAPIAIAVAKVLTASALAVDSNPLSAGATLHLSAQVGVAAGATAYGPLSGPVVFTDNGQTIATITMGANGAATYAATGLSVGTHTLSALYGGNSTYAASTVSTIVTVVQTAATATLTTVANPTLAGDPATFNIAVTSSTGTPTGNVTLRDGGTNLVTTTLHADGTAGVSLATLAVGNHALTAVYSGDANYTAVTSAVLTQTVNLASPSVTLAGPSAPVNVSASATFSSTLSSPGVAPTGSLTLQEGSTVLGTQQVTAGGTFAFASSALAVGTHTLVVHYSGDGHNAPANSAPFALDVQLAPTTTALSGSVSPQTLGAAVSLVATVTSATANLTGAVTFFDGQTTIGTAPLTNGSATITTSALPVGRHTLTATYNGDSAHTSSLSAAMPLNIVQPASINLSSSLNPSNTGQPVTFTAVVPTLGGTAPTGTVTFTDNGIPMTTASLDGAGTAQVQTATLALGAHTITASYSGDGNYATALASTAQTVRSAMTTTTIAVSLDPSPYGDPLMLSARVTSNGGAATGTVSFVEGGSVIGNAALAANGTATLAVSTLSPGRHNIVASYLGDGKASPSTSAAVSFLVRRRTTLSLGSDANPALTLAGIAVTATLGNGNAAVAGGSIVFTEGATTLGSVPLANDGQATLNLPALSAGTHTILATYAGDDADFPAGAPAFALVVQRRATNTVLTSSATNAADPQQVTLIAVVQSLQQAQNAVPGGTVTFTSGGSTIGVMPVDAAGVATLNVRLASGGSEGVVASYSGDVSFDSSASDKSTIAAGLAAQFTLAVSNSAVAVQSGNHTTVNVVVTSIKSFSDTLRFGCAGLPYAATCTFSKTVTQLNADGSATLQLTIDTGDPLGAGTGVATPTTGRAVPRPSFAPALRNVPVGEGIAACLVPAALLLSLRRRYAAPVLLALMLLTAAALGTAGCGGLKSNGTPAGTYTFQVTATGQATGASQAQTVTLTVK